MGDGAPPDRHENMILRMREGAGSTSLEVYDAIVDVLGRLTARQPLTKAERHAFLDLRSIAETGPSDLPSDPRAHDRLQWHLVHNIRPGLFDNQQVEEN